MVSADAIWNIKPDEAIELESRGKQGDPDSLVKWAQFTVWKRIRDDRTIPARRKRALFRQWCDMVHIKAIYENPDLNLPMESPVG